MRKHTDDALEFWKDNQTALPILAKTAKIYLGSEASSSPEEKQPLTKPVRPIPPGKRLPQLTAEEEEEQAVAALIEQEEREKEYTEKDEKTVIENNPDGKSAEIVFSVPSIFTQTSNFGFVQTVKGDSDPDSPMPSYNIKGKPADVWSIRAARRVLALLCDPLSANRRPLFAAVSQLRAIVVVFPTRETNARSWETAGIVAGDSRLLENFDKASMKPSFAFIEFPHHVSNTCYHFMLVSGAIPSINNTTARKTCAKNGNFDQMLRNLLEMTHK
ncbi:hypothetical protein DdX_17537 [Ditylenchus destructor]|uniref:Uncharacterized protein n=1 Tax=Ditylenchus destructor TaxID=166010 RepID=A0AAD4ML70_9BILA|nr:hypothetical protein DdX_17537 [Ditylenchus destructor]